MLNYYDGYFMSPFCLHNGGLHMVVAEVPGKLSKSEHILVKVEWCQGVVSPPHTHTRAHTMTSLFSVIVKTCPALSLTLLFPRGLVS